MKKLKNIIITGEKGNGMSYSNIEIFTVRNNADFNRMDMSSSQRKRYHRKQKLEKRNIIKEEKLSIFSF